MRLSIFYRAMPTTKGGHAIVGWALGLLVVEIMIRDDRPGEHAEMDGSATLTLLDQVAVWNAGRIAEEVFDHLLPSWATGRDRALRRRADRFYSPWSACCSRRAEAIGTRAAAGKATPARSARKSPEKPWIGVMTARPHHKIEDLSDEQINHTRLGVAKPTD